MRVKARCLRETFRKDDFRILNWSPYEKKGLELSKYFTFSTKGNDGWADVGKDYELEIELEKVHPQFGGTYKIVGVPSVEAEDIASMSIEEKKNILMQCTSSERIADNILSVYPDYIERVLNEGADSIDTKPIKNVGSSYHHAYCRKLFDKYKYFYIFNKYSDYKIDMVDAKKISEAFGSDEEISGAFKKDPYNVLINICGKSFLSADKIIVNLNPQFRETELRCSYLMLDVLDKNEQESGSTRLNGNDLYFYIQNELNYPELLPLVVPTAQKSELIHFDEATKDLAKMNTYLGECKIADFIKTKLANNHVLDIDWTKYTKFDDGSELTAEQSNALKLFCEKDFILLTGSAGCVDAETEFFNGKCWKKISEYAEDDLVLQYNEDGSANLVKPYRYINEPCDMMYHFETKYGIDQTLTPDHRNVVISPKGKMHEFTTEEIKNMQENLATGFNYKFMSSFRYNGEGIDLTDAEIKLMCAVICDGSFYGKANRKQDSWNICRFHIKKERKKIRLREVFKECDLEWREKESTAEGYTDFYIKAPRREKEFTEYWYNCSQHQLQIICDNILFWDGNINYTKNGKIRRRFSTNVKTTAEFIQFAYSACNMRATINIRDRRGRIRTVNGKDYVQTTLEYSVSITDRTNVGLSKPNDKGETTKIESVIPSDGRKYCFTVPSNMLVLRRNNKIFITGNCGKTKSLQAILDLCDDNKLTYSLFAFTGAASLRITEATHRPASTIHRPYYQEREFDSDVIVCDEFSMDDIEAICMLLSMISNPDAKVIFVGDNFQLLPIGCGNPFNDIINSHSAPNNTLTQVFRYNSSGLLFVATNVRKGIDFFDDEIVKKEGNVYKVYNNYRFYDVDEDDIVDTVVQVYTEYLKKYKPKDILTTSPFNVGDCGTYAINNIIQNIVNPSKPNETCLTRKIGQVTINFRVGDKVINKKNDYKALTLESYQMIEESNGLLSADDVPHTTVFNGQIGYIRDLNEKYCTIQFDEELLVFDKNKMAHDVLLGYCISVHSSQGGSAKATLNIVSEKHRRMHNRNIFYVAGTRAEEIHTDIGSVKAFKDGIKIDGNKQRDTFLKELLTEQQGLDN